MVDLKGTTPVEATRGMMKDKYIFLHPSKYLTLGAFHKIVFCYRGFMVL